MTVFSKDDFTHDIPCEDMSFIVEDDDTMVYLIDDYLYTEKGLFTIPDDYGTDSFRELRYLVIQMIKRYMWYMNIDKSQSQKIYDKYCHDKTLGEIYDSFDYPALRDAKCPYRCGGCKIMKTCGYCGINVSMCQIIILHLTDRDDIDCGKYYYCSNTCKSAYHIKEETPEIRKQIRDYTEMAEKSSRVVHFLNDALKSKSKMISGKARRLMEKDKHKAELTLQEYLTFKALYENLLSRDVKQFDINFEKLKNIFVEQMDIIENDAALIKDAAIIKTDIECFDTYRDMFFG